MTTEDTSADDEELVRRIAAGSSGALSDLYDRYASLLLGLARRMLGSTEDAEEVVQEALLHAWKIAGRYDPARSSVSTWLTLILRSRAIDRLRSERVVERTRSTVEKENRSPHTSPEGVRAVLSRERRQRIRRELALLPEEQEQVLQLAFYGGMTQREIAARTGIPLGTVKTRTLLAMKKLRAALGSEVGEFL